MGKGKKSKKEHHEEVESDVEETQVDVKNDSEDDDLEKEKVNKKNTKKSKSKKKTKNSDDEEEQSEGGSDVEKITKNMKKIALKTKTKSKREDDDNEEDDDVETKPSKSNKKSKQKTKVPIFSLLNVDSDGGSENESENEPEVVEPKKGKPKKQQDISDEEQEIKPVAQAGGKKSKKSKKKQHESDEDIDKVLAELEMEYSGVKIERTENEKEQPPTTSKSDKKQKKGKPEAEQEPAAENENDDDQEGSTMKTAAQKKKEKKERQKREAALLKQQAKELGVSESELKKEKTQSKTPAPKNEPTPDREASAEPTTTQPTEESTDKKKKKKDKSKPGAEETKKEEKSRKGPSKSVVAAMQEQLRKLKEEEERLKKEEEERLKRLEEAEELRLEQLRLEQEKKEKKKQKEKERKERLKAEGKLLTNKQRQDKMRALAMLEALKAQGVEIPEPGEKRPRPGTRVRNKKKDLEEQKVEENQENKSSEKTENEKESEENSKEEVIEKIKEEWDASSDSEDTKSRSESPQPTSQESKTPEKTITKQKSSEKSESESEEESSDEEDDDEDDNDEDSDSNEEDNKHLDAEQRKQRVRERIDKRRHEAEKKRTTDNLRAAVVCVLGHVDTGKTKILDKLRRTHVQDSEAGGITQQIGATNVPIDAIKEQTRIVKNSNNMVYKLPGLLIIDTPGHESFSNLRNRGSSLCDIAILVVDIMHGLEPQTIESLNLLKSRKTPFIVALNKIDRLYDWQSMVRKDVHEIIKGQQANTQLEFQKRSQEVILQFAEQGLNAALYYENPDPRSYVSLVPTSAITGEGMGNLLYLIVEACQTHLAKRLMYSEELLATVLEVKATPGFGTTIDCILINGKLREGETMIVAGTEGPIVTQIRSLLMPQPLKELRVKNAYIDYKEIIGAQGVKIAAKELEKAIAGLNLQIAHKPDEVELMKEEVARELKSALNSIKLSQLGVYVQASTLGSLEALLEFLKASKIPYSSIRIGPVVKRDVMKASTMLEHEPQFATILAFDVKIERDAQELADSLGVKIFQADIIYHLFDRFMEYREQLKQKKRDEFKSIAVFPCKLKILPQFIFNSRDPIVMGVIVEAGIVKEGTPICVPSKEFVDLGIVTSIESNHKQIESARKGQEVCIKIEPTPGEAPKMFGRHFEETDMLVSKISRQSIDACKEYFRDDLVKADWALMVELKKQFQIL